MLFRSLLTYLFLIIDRRLDIVNVDLKEKPEWLFEKNPDAKVPTIETTQGSLYESLLVSDYLDEVYPNRPLYSKDAFKKTLDRIWIEQIPKVLSTVQCRELFDKLIYAIYLHFR